MLLVLKIKTEFTKIYILELHLYVSNKLNKMITLKWFVKITHLSYIVRVKNIVYKSFKNLNCKLNLFF